MGTAGSMREVSGRLRVRQETEGARGIQRRGGEGKAKGEGKGGEGNGRYSDSA